MPDTFKGYHRMCVHMHDAVETGILGRHGDPIIVESMRCLVCDDFAVVILTSVEGYKGAGIARPLAPDVATLVGTVGRECVVGSNARDLHRTLLRIREQPGMARSSAVNATLAWLELALLDLVGRSLDRPVAELLGGVRRNRIPLYLSSHGRGRTPEAEIDSISQQLEATGMRAVKLKIGTGGQRGDDGEEGPRRVERLVPFARKQLGDDVTLYADANGSFGLDRAVEVARVLSDNGVAWFEEPCPGNDHQVLEQIARRSSLPIAWGEKASRLSDFQRVLSTGVCGVAQPDLWRVGGLLEARTVAAFAETCGAPTTLKSTERGGLSFYGGRLLALTTSSCIHTLSVPERVGRRP